MFILTKEIRFEASHRLVYHDGKCRQLHGHSYKLQLHLRGEKLELEGPKSHMLIDFAEIKQIVEPLIEDYLDHHYLNETLQCDSPTVEFVARWIYQFLVEEIPLLYAVTLFETNSSWVTYTPHGNLISLSQATG